MDPSEMKQAGIVLINYFNDKEVISFVANELYRQTSASFQVVVVNNGSHDHTLKDYCLQQPRIQFLEPGRNLGYLGGFLFAFRQLKFMPDLLILSNTDIAFKDPHFFEKLETYQLKEDEVMIGPDIVSTRTWHHQNPFYAERISDARLRIMSMAFSSYPVYALYRILSILKSSGKKHSDHDMSARHVYAIHGSFMIFKSSFIQDYYNELADAPFLFGEELQFAEVAALHDLKTVFDPQLE